MNIFHINFKLKKKKIKNIQRTNGKRANIHNIKINLA